MKRPLKKPVAAVCDRRLGAEYPVKTRRSQAAATGISGLFSGLMKIFLLIGLAVALGTNLGRADGVVSPAGRMELFNGRDFSGWTFCMSGGANPRATWSVTNGVIHCTGRPTGYIRTEQSYANYELDVTWRFIKLAPKADNTGILVHLQLPDKVWPKCIQVQGKHERQGDLFLMAGAESNEHRGLEANTPLPLHGVSAELPVGEWNTATTICSNDIVVSYINGKWMNQTTGCTITNGAVGFQSEGGDLEIRRVTLVPLGGGK